MAATKDTEELRAVLDTLREWHDEIEFESLTRGSPRNALYQFTGILHAVIRRAEGAGNLVPLVRLAKGKQ